MTATVSMTALDRIAQQYLQAVDEDSTSQLRLAYLESLRACRLDGSLESLKQLDVLLSRIRREWLSQSVGDADNAQPDRSHTQMASIEAAFLQRSDNRGLLLFMGFYAGQVLATAWQAAPQWYGQAQLARAFKQLPLSDQDFYHFMAVAYQPADHYSDGRYSDGRYYDSQQAAAGTGCVVPPLSALFFVLEPIGQRLFASIDHRIRAVQGGQVDDSLYHAVKRRLPSTVTPKHKPQTRVGELSPTQSKPKPQPQQQTRHEPPQQSPQPSNVQHIRQNQPAPDLAKKPAQQPAQQAATKPSLAEHKQPDQQTSSEGLANAVTTTASAYQPIRRPPKPVRQDMFTQLRADLSTQASLASLEDKAYQKACHILNQFDDHIAKHISHKGITANQVAFSQQHQSIRTRAIATLEQSAKRNNPDAMLRLASYLLLGEGVEKDETAALAWIQQAAQLENASAQRLLSKLYYQGVGVKQDMDVGKYWLDKAASNGHPEAQQVRQALQLTQDLQHEQRQERKRDSRYLMLLVAVVTMAVMMLLFIKV